MKNRLPIAVSVTALVVALLGTTGVAQAVQSATVSFAANAGKLRGFAPSKTSKKNTVVVRGANGKIDARSIPAQARGAAGPQGAQGPPGAPNPNAVNAQNADKLNGLGSDAFMQRTAQPGQIFTGVISVARRGGDTVGGLGQGVFPVPLSASYADFQVAPHASCPGEGDAAPGVVCVYVFNSANGTVGEGVNSVAGRRFGFNVVLLWSNQANDSYAQGSWAFKVPG